MMKTLLKPFALALALTAGTAAVIAATPPLRGNWIAKIVPTAAGGHLRGNPDAKVKLVEYVSYTCNHCAEFEKQSDAELLTGFIKDGQGSVEIRPFLRNKIDITASLLVQCGPASKVFGNHSAMLRGQAKWLQSPNQAQQARWNNPDFGTAMRAIASDLKLYDLMATRGYTRVQLDKCLTNKPLAERIAKQTGEAVEKLGINGTPAFLINGELVPGHDWLSLRPRLMLLTR
jgi:protein-disulfide isomerase